MISAHEVITPLRTRFAPSPTGLLHVGNGYSALLCQQWADQHGAELLLRIEDIDQIRCRSHFTAAIKRDLQWLGVQWQPEVMVQSRRTASYQKALATLQQQRLLYPCFCSRADIRAQLATSAPHHTAPSHYPGRCRALDPDSVAERMRTEPYSWRINVEAAAEVVGEELEWVDSYGISHTFNTHAVDDAILARRDIGISYHLAVVVDDAAQNISMVIRGEDLLDSTDIQRLLQQLLKLPAPRYLHHKLIIDSSGKRLAKRNHSTTLHSLAQAGVSPTELRELLWQLVADSHPWEQSSAQLLLHGSE
ncbi:MAG: tRNA glutamyl-Q(34) synthetase GluQRS [Mariprofundales bacterium]|nr:tRNA glutamyl-Q(34) synthetase GluQRS [Mariprofundales bacterium]